MKHSFATPALFCALVFFAVPHLHAQDEGGIKQAMTPEEFRKAGLDKLSDEELGNLDRWLRGDREKTAKKASAKVSKAKMDLIVSRVNGTFGGLSGRTVIELEDGTAWKQANADDHFRGSSVDHPGAAAYRSFMSIRSSVKRFIQGRARRPREQLQIAVTTGPSRARPNASCANRAA